MEQQSHLPVHHVFRRISHHASHSGYDQLSRFVGSAIHVPSLLNRMRGLGPVHRYFRKRSGMEWYDGLYPELAASFHMAFHAPGIYHFLYADNDFRYAPSAPWSRKHRIVCTYHATPGEFLRVMGSTGHLKRADVLIGISSVLLPLLERVAGGNRVCFLPYGVDASYFTPGPAHEKAPGSLLLCVGHHCRDLETLCNVAAILKAADPKTQILLVDRVFDHYYPLAEREKYRAAFKTLGNITLRTDAGEEELLALYRSADLLLMPLVDSTANTAVNEAMACGLPLAITDVGGVKDYAVPGCALYSAPGDAKAMAENALRILQEKALREQMAVACRKRAEELDWPVVAEQMRSLYRQIS